MEQSLREAAFLMLIRSKAIETRLRLQALGIRPCGIATRLCFHSARIVQLAVGYESPSQFGREFMRFFGGRPADEGIRPRNLSITHKLSTQFDSEVNVGESRQPTPQDRIAGRAIVLAMEIAAESGHGQDAVGHILWKGVPWAAGELVQNRNFGLRKYRVGRRFRIRSMDHRQPEDPPSNDAEHGDQVR